MKTITVWQPWATLIAIGAKPYEFRGWVPPASLIGQRIAIHAAARPMKLGELLNLRSTLKDPRLPTPCLHQDMALGLLEEILAKGKAEIPKALPLSHVLCTAVLGTPKRGDICAQEFGENLGNDSDREGTFNWGWPMLDIERLEPPIPARGMQGFWSWTP